MSTRSAAQPASVGYTRDAPKYVEVLSSARDFVDVSCTNPTHRVTTSQEDFSELERVDKFVYLGHRLDTTGGFDHAVNQSSVSMENFQTPGRYSCR